MRRIQLAVLLVVVLAPPVFADQITLKNGDRMTGTIISSDAKTLVIKTEYADAVTIKWDFVQQIESSQPLYVGTKGGQVIVGPVTTSDSKLAVATKESGSVTVAKADVTSLRNADEQKKAEAALDRLQHPRLADLWAGTLDTGLGLVRGNSESSNFTFGLNAVRASTRDKITLYTNSAFSRSAVNGVTVHHCPVHCRGSPLRPERERQGLRFRHRGSVQRPLPGPRFADGDWRGRRHPCHQEQPHHVRRAVRRHLQPGILHHVQSLFR